MKQSRIDIESDAGILLSYILRYNGLVWCTQMFTSFLKWRLTRIDKALMWLKEQKLVYECQDQFRPTQEGEQYHEDIKSKSEITVNNNAWKAEVLTGVKQTESKRRNGDWQRSEIDNGVLHKSNCLKTCEETTPENIYLKKEGRAKQEQELSKELHVTVAKLRELIKNKRIKMCKGIDRPPHRGRFHKKGLYLRPYCVECMKKRRRKQCGVL